MNRDLDRLNQYRRDKRDRSGFSCYNPKRKPPKRNGSMLPAIICVAIFLSLLATFSWWAK